MEVRQLRHFAAVAETLHFGRAASQLGITQPPLSQSILALERELGEPLFARTKRSVALTSFGRQWLRHVREVLNGLDALPEIAAGLRGGAAGSLALAFVSVADFSILPDLVRLYRERFPAVALQLTEATSDVQIAALLGGHGDAGLIIEPAIDLPAALEYRRLWSEPLVAVIPETWIANGMIVPVAGRLSAQDIGTAPLILFPQHVAPSFHALVTDYCRSSGAAPHVAQEAIQMQTIISLVAAGLGAAIVPASLRNLVRPGACYLELVNAPRLDMGIVWRREHPSPTVRNLIAVATDLCAC